MGLSNTKQFPVSHQPIKFSRYLEIHETVINKFKDTGFIGNENLEFNCLTSYVTLHGEIACLGGIVIATVKNIRIIENFGKDLLVQTETYSYNASVRNSGNILRYDNAHSHPGHSDPHHKHIFDWKTDEEVAGSPIWVGVDNWLNFGQVIREIEKWYWDNKQELLTPNSYPPIGLR